MQPLGAAVLRVRQQARRRSTRFRRRRRITYAEDYHAYPAYAEDEHVIGGGAEGLFDAEQGQASALVKRISNVHTIDLALRSSHRTLSCPGENDGEQACARNCAAEHLTKLRAFTVTGAVESPSPPPRRRTSPAPSPPPLPPYTPFSECQTTCEGVVAGDTKCRDGGKGSWLPTVCPYATQCAQCGFRENTREIEPDDTCATAPTACARTAALAPRPSSTTRSTRTRARRPTAAWEPTPPTAADYGPRTSQEIGSEAYQGVTNETQPGAAAATAAGAAVAAASTLCL